VKYFILFILTALFQIGMSQNPLLPDEPWHFLDTKTIGAYNFEKAHPTFDGRGVVIIICDTGIDTNIPGLIKTSEGKVKVIDVQDFSGQGDIPLKKASFDTINGVRRIKSDDIHLSGFENCSYKPVDEVYWLGCIDEKKAFQNSKVSDINNNGKFDDIFAIVTFPVKIDNEDRWVYYVDENADGRIDDQIPRFDYRYKYDCFTLAGRDPDKQKAVLTFAINIRPEDKIASLNSCDNAHGTHCAGIAAGCEIFNEPTQHGIAPGAQVISCKIGDGTLSGGATRSGSMKKAYDYGIKWAEEHHMPIVFSTSYGVDSEIEGRSDIENLLNNLMVENENILMVNSNGNSGPGLSTAGNPSCANRILSVGAMLPAASARDSYGFSTGEDRIFLFSSRGGEVNKPDCIAPGAAASTVPAYSENENMWGTSMACPQLAGAAAVLISACLQEKIPFNGALVKRALKFSATPLPGYSPLDQGTGFVNIPRAFEIMKTFAQRFEHQAVLDYEIETASPVYPDETGMTAYWRCGNYIPSLDEKQIFKVKAILPKNLTADQKQKFYRAFELKVDQPWFKLDKTSTYIKADHSASIGGFYQRELLKQPGLYVCKITAFPKSGPGQDIPEFELLNSIIVPYEFHSGNNFQVDMRNKNLKPGELHRYFVLIPPGASAMNIQVSKSPGMYCGVRGYIYNAEGVKKGSLPEMSRDKTDPVLFTCSGDELDCGVWEVDICAYYNVPQNSTYDLSVSFEGIKVEPGIISKIDYRNGEKPSGELIVVNNYHTFKGSVTGEISGYCNSRNEKITHDKYIYPFKVDENISKVAFILEMDKAIWNLFTDVSANIKDKNGKIVKSDGFEHRKLEISFQPASADEYQLEIIAAFALPEKMNQEWQLQCTEKYFTKEPIQVRFEKPDYQVFPGMAKVLKFELDNTPRLTPKGFTHFGEIRFNRLLGGSSARTDIRFENGTF
jgi:tripeptidyl-peptidase II